MAIVRGDPHPLEDADELGRHHRTLNHLLWIAHMLKDVVDPGLVIALSRTSHADVLCLLAHKLHAVLLVARLDPGRERSRVADDRFAQVLALEEERAGPSPDVDDRTSLEIEARRMTAAPVGDEPHAWCVRELLLLLVGGVGAGPPPIGPCEGEGCFLSQL